MFSSSEGEDILGLVQLATMQRQIRFWVNPLWLQKARKYAIFDVMKKLRIYPDRTGLDKLL